MHFVKSQHNKGFALFDTIKRIREKNAQLFCGSAIILALSISGCTTSSGTNLLENAAADIAAAETSESADNATATNTKTANGADTAKATLAANTPVPNSPEAAKQLAAAQTEKPVQVASADTALAATAQVIQPAETATPAEQPSTLAALFGTRNKPTAALAAAEQAEAAPASQPKVQETTTQTETTKPENNARAVPVAPAIDRTSQSAGAAARLFSPGKNSPRGNSKQEATVTASATSPKRTTDYNYTLPGVRANGGIEIRHSNKVFDESDIDLDEDDFSAPVTLASAGGMARLAPNGLRTQHDKVQVSCLKPQLVSMIKRLESHYRKPVVITSGYRSPSHNRSVSGAKRSLHMSCAAADLQIPGVSKWEIARQVRTWPGRGGVGTYCHTESVHIDVGPERDWNWRCRRK